MRTRMLSIVAVMLLAQACAAVDEPTQRPDEREYVTGSRIPQKDKSRTISGTSVLEGADAQRALEGPMPSGAGKGP